MTTKSHFAIVCAVSVASIVLTAWRNVTAQPASTNSSGPRWVAACAAAQVHYQHNHWQEAYEAFAALADQGHPSAARIALLMWRHGPALYGREFHPSSPQVEAWTVLAAGQPVLETCPVHLSAS